MSDIFDNDDLDSINRQMLEGKSSETIDVTATDVTDDGARRKFRIGNLTWRQKVCLAGAVIATIVVIAVVLKKQNEAKSDVALPANISAILERPVTKSPAPADQALPSPANAAITAQAVDIAATQASTPVAVTQQPISAVAATPTSPPVAPPEQLSSVQPSQANDVDLLKKELAAVKNELTSKTAEIAALKSTAKTRPAATDEKPAAKSVAITKPKLKERHALSMKASGIAVLMDSGLIYSLDGESFVEVFINQNFPGYGKLVRVDKDAKTFETPNHIYYLKD